MTAINQVILPENPSEEMLVVMDYVLENGYNEKSIKMAEGLDIAVYLLFADVATIGFDFIDIWYITSMLHPSDDLLWTTFLTSAAKMISARSGQTEFKFFPIQRFRTIVGKTNLSKYLQWGKELDIRVSVNHGPVHRISGDSFIHVILEKLLAEDL